MKSKKEKVNELYALHFRGELVEPGIWKKYSTNYGGSGLYGWRPPKKIYYTLGHARAAIQHLPSQIQPDIAIVRYIPGEVVEHSSASVDSYNKKKEAKKKKQEEIQKEYTKKRIKSLQTEIDTLTLKVNTQ